MGGWRAPLATMIVAVMLLAGAAVYIGAHWLLPSDGTTLDFSEQAPAAGLAIGLWRHEPGGLMPGDVVLAIDRYSLDDWILGAAGRPATVWTAKPVYTVLRAGQRVSVPVPLGRYDVLAALGNNWAFELSQIYQFGVSLLIFVLRPRLPAARALFLLCATLLASSAVYFLGLQAGDLGHSWLVALWLWSVVVLFGISMAGLLHLSFLFPRVRLVIARRPALLGLVYAGVWLIFLGLVVAGWPQAATAGARLSLLVRSTTGITAVYFPLVLVNSIVSYRQSELEAERRQMRWFVLGIYVAVVPWLALSVGPGLFGLPALAHPILFGVLWCAIPTAMAIAILRERLFDIDLIIRRTLVYSVLTIALALVYFGSVVVLQTAFAALTGQRQSTLVTVVSTLAIAALFGPARRRVQAFIDRRFFRRKYDAARTLTAFGATLRDHVDLQDLCDRLQSVVDESMQPEHSSLWIRPDAAPAVDPRQPPP